MLMPKRVKFRRVQRGRMKGKATRGNVLSNGKYGIVALEPAWITSNQIEAARIAMTRYTKRGQRFSLTSRSPKSLPTPEWVPVKVLRSTGLPW